VSIVGDVVVVRVRQGGGFARVWVEEAHAYLFAMKKSMENGFKRPLRNETLCL